jgi:hypothetical protein
MIIDSVIWSLPHFIVWRLRLRRAHKIAISAIFALGLLCDFKCLLSVFSSNTDVPCSNILVAFFRIFSIVRVDFRGSMTDRLDTAMICIYAQLSTAIVLTCCPLLRPVFEKMVPRRFTRIRRKSSLHRQSTSAKIQKTTKILVHPASGELRSQPRGIIHDGAYVEPMAPKFEVERSEPIPGRRMSCLL